MRVVRFQRRVNYLKSHLTGCRCKMYSNIYVLILARFVKLDLRYFESKRLVLLGISFDKNRLVISWEARGAFTLYRWYLDVCAPVCNRLNERWYVCAVSGEYWKYELYDIDYMLCDNVLYNVLYRLCIHTLIRKIPSIFVYHLFFTELPIRYAWHVIRCTIFHNFPIISWQRISHLLNNI